MVALATLNQAKLNIKADREELAYAA